MFYDLSINKEMHYDKTFMDRFFAVCKQSPCV